MPHDLSQLSQTTVAAESNSTIRVYCQALGHFALCAESPRISFGGLASLHIPASGQSQARSSGHGQLASRRKNRGSVNLTEPPGMKCEFTPSTLVGCVCPRQHVLHGSSAASTAGETDIGCIPTYQAGNIYREHLGHRGVR